MTKQQQIEELEARLASAKKELRKVLHVLDLHCRACCGNSLTEAKRCGMKDVCRLYPYNPRFIEKNREKVDSL